MAAELFMNLDDIDLDQVAYSARDLDDMIPQCGDMRQIDHVVWVNVDASLCVTVRHVRDDEFWVPGHIPGRPILPGVLIIESAGQASSILYRLKTKADHFIGFIRCDDAVFRGQVVPGDVLHFITKEIEFGNRRFITRTQGISQGKLVFEAKVTGMRM